MRETAVGRTVTVFVDVVQRCASRAGHKGVCDGTVGCLKWYGKALSCTYSVFPVDLTCNVRLFRGVV